MNTEGGLKRETNGTKRGKDRGAMRRLTEELSTKWRIGLVL